MAIKINQGTAPKLGRLTMPRGTYLSDPPPVNPPTQPDGQLGASSGMMPATPPGGNPFDAYNPAAPVWQQATQNPPSLIGQDVWSSIKNWFRSGLESDPNVQNAVDWMRGEGRYGANPDPLLRDILNPAPSNRDVFNNTSNSLVGNDLGASPSVMSQQTVNNLFPGVSGAKVAENMKALGYMMVYTTEGPKWVKNPNAQPTTNATTAAMGPTDNRGRPEWVDPTALARNERVTTQSGLTFVGGTPTKEGQAQYALTIPGGQDDERYKWASDVQRDSDGNWVKIYKRELRSVYSRSHQRKLAARREEAAVQAQAQAEAQAQAQQSASVETPVAFDQLVNFRADFG